MSRIVHKMDSHNKYIRKKQLNRNRELDNFIH